MTIPFNLLGLLFILASVFFLFAAFRRYEGRFEDASLFLSFVFGLIIGAGVFFGELLLFGGGLVLIIGGAVLGEGIKTAVLNSKRYRNKPDTPYYGGALGAGFGVVTAMLGIGLYNSNFGDSGGMTLWFIIFAASLILFYWALGIVVGYGCATDHPIRSFAYAAGGHAGLTLLIPGVPAIPVDYLALVILALSAAAAYLAAVRILPRTMSNDDLRKERRETRKKMRGESP